VKESSVAVYRSLPSLPTLIYEHDWKDWTRYRRWTTKSLFTPTTSSHVLALLIRRMRASHDLGVQTLQPHWNNR
jgi:hypothetical protein